MVVRIKTAFGHFLWVWETLKKKEDLRVILFFIQDMKRPVEDAWKEFKSKGFVKTLF